MDVKAAIYYYCNYQERCHKEVTNKLYALGCNTTEVGQYITDLIEEGLLNEERYACGYARGKFRILHWGRQKIVQQLKTSNISAYCITKAMKEIDGNEYNAIAEKLVTAKWQELKKERSVRLRMAKVYRYMLQKGYEREIVMDILNELKQH
jgi:regulatory protein